MDKFLLTSSVWRKWSEQMKAFMGSATTAKGSSPSLTAQYWIWTMLSTHISPAWTVYPLNGLIFKFLWNDQIWFALHWQILSLTLAQSLDVDVRVVPSLAFCDGNAKWPSHFFKSLVAKHLGKIKRLFCRNIRWTRNSTRLASNKYASFQTLPRISTIKKGMRRICWQKHWPWITWVKRLVTSRALFFRQQGRNK